MPILPPRDGSWSSLNWSEVLGTAIGASTVGLIHMLYMVRRGRRFRWLDLLLEPSLALLAGMMVWGVLEVTGLPKVLQGVLTSLGAWGGPKTIHWLELKYFGGTRLSDSDNMPLGGPNHG